MPGVSGGVFDCLFGNALGVSGTECQTGLFDTPCLEVPLEVFRVPLGGSWDALWVLLGLLASSWGSWGGFVEVPGVSGGDFDAYALECHDALH